jgi:hypothetical protein
MRELIVLERGLNKDDPQRKSGSKGKSARGPAK